MQQKATKRMKKDNQILLPLSWKQKMNYVHWSFYINVRIFKKNKILVVRILIVLFTEWQQILFMYTTNQLMFF